MQLRRSSLVRSLTTSLVLIILVSGFGLAADPPAAAAAPPPTLSTLEFSEKYVQLNGLIKDLSIGAFSFSGGDATGDGEVTVTDIFYLINYLFAGGPAPMSVSAGGDLSGTYPDPTVATVGGQTAADVAAATVLANGATHLNTAGTIVKRDGAGDFAAGNINATLLGNATTATTAVDFSGLLEGDVTGKQDETVVAVVGGQSAASVADATLRALNNPSAQQVALLRWYPANQTVISFPVGMNPRGGAFDGANVWIANQFGDDVTKLRAVDGAPQGTFPLAGIDPYALAFDGANIWSTNTGSNTVTKLRASDGVCVGTCTFTVGAGPRGIAFDGTFIWVGNSGSDQVMKLKMDGSIDATVVVDNPFGMAFDGAHLWIASPNAIAGSPGTLTKLQVSDNTVLTTIDVGIGAIDVVFDGAYIWVANQGSDNVMKLRASDNSIVGTFPVGDEPFDLVFDGANIWVANRAGDTVTKLRASDGAPLGTFPVGDDPRALVFDGANVWVTSFNGHNVLKL